MYPLARQLPAACFLTTMSAYATTPPGNHYADHYRDLPSRVSAPTRHARGRASRVSPAVIDLEDWSL